MKTAIAAEALKSSPPVTILSIAWMQGLSINEVVGLATLAYIGLQAVYLIWKAWREYRGRNETNLPVAGDRPSRVR